MKELSACWRRSGIRGPGSVSRNPGARLAGLLLMVLAVTVSCPSEGQAHRRGGLSLSRPDPHPASAATPLRSDPLSGPLELNPEAYLQRLTGLEKAGRGQEAWELGVRLLNLFPKAPQKQAALKLLAELARKRGQTEAALEIWRLAALHTAGAKEVSQARLEEMRLEFDMDLQSKDPVPAMRGFLEQLRARFGEQLPEQIRESLKTGWEALGKKVRASSPPSLELLEEVLRLWEMQPENWAPPEAALLLADLLKEHHLLEEARAVLAKMEKQQPRAQESRLRLYSLELAWLSQGWPGLVDTLHSGVKGDEERKALVALWLTSRLQQPQASPEKDISSTGEALWAWFLPQPARAAWLAGQTSALALKHPWPFPLSGPTSGEVAKRFWTDDEAATVAKVYKTLAKETGSEDLVLFYRERLGLSHFQGGQPDAAQVIFAELAQQPDPFWQCLGQVRLADMELARWQTEVSP